MLGSLERETVVVSGDAIRTAPAPIRGIAYIHFSGSEPRIERLTAGESALELLRNAVNFNDHKQAAVERAVALATRIPACRLAYGAPDQAARTLLAEFA
jgi:hypothetical protein